MYLIYQQLSTFMQATELSIMSFAKPTQFPGHRIAVSKHPDSLTASTRLC